MIAAMHRAGYPAGFSASVVGGAAATDILIPPSVAFIIYSVLVPGASVPALFAAGMIPGVLAGHGADRSRRVDGPPSHKMGALEASMPAPAVLEKPARSRLGPGRAGADSGRHARRLVHPHRGRRGGRVLRPVRRHGRSTARIGVRDLFPILREAGELSAVILIVVSLAGIFAFSLSTLGVIDPVAKAIVNSGLGEYGVLALLILLLITVGMFLDGISIFLIFVPLLLPIMEHYHWDPVWFGVILTLEGGAGPVHTAAGREPDGGLPHRRRAHGIHRALGAAGCCWPCSWSWCW